MLAKSSDPTKVSWMELMKEALTAEMKEAGLVQMRHWVSNSVQEK